MCVLLCLYVHGHRLCVCLCICANERVCVFVCVCLNSMCEYVYERVGVRVNVLEQHVCACVRVCL